MESPCRCSAYRWPHAPGVGLCHYAPKEPMTVVEILRIGSGLTLARTDTNHYLVGICYTLGAKVPQVNPYVDFLCTTNREIADHYFTAREKG